MINKSRALIIAATFLSLTSYSDDQPASKYYLGFSGGLSIPLKTKFEIKDEGDIADVKVEKSYMGTVNFGYRIAEGAAIEFAVDFKPKYPMTIIIDGTSGPAKTKAIATIFLINFVYDLAKFHQLQPYFVAGVGIADIKVKPAASFFPAPYNTQEAFVLKNNHRTTLAFQIGLGAKYPITDAVQLDVAMKLQGITNVKLQYQKFSKTEGKLKDKSTKQHLGVGEVVAGLTFNF